MQARDLTHLIAQLWIEVTVAAREVNELEAQLAGEILGGGECALPGGVRRVISNAGEHREGCRVGGVSGRPLNQIVSRSEVLVNK